MTSFENITSLKYEKTQNRDIVGTIERINNSEKFKDVSEKILSEIAKIASDGAKKSMKSIWRNVHESHENPKDLVINVAIGSPIYRKFGDSFYYTMIVHTMFFMDLGEGVEDGSDEEIKISKWFSENVSSSLNREIVEKIKTSIDDKTKDGAGTFFHYSLLEKSSENDNDGKIGRMPELNKINFSYISSLRNSRLNGESSISSDSIPFIESDAIHDGTVSNLALSFARIDESVKIKGK